MRLTLRTLLAYLDDVLDASQTREIGQKIRESPRAAALVSRIREAIRKRRLGAPDLEGPGQGLDPNLVAAYLDDSLTPEQVVDVEQVCLDADVQLAEVAACHQILTLLMAESREVPQVSLDRYYALGPVPFDDRLQADGAEGAASRPPVTAAATTGDATADFVARLPDYLKPSPWSQRVAPLAGVALIVVMAVVLLAMDRDLFRGLAKNRQAEGLVVQNQPAVPADVQAPPVRGASGGAESPAPMNTEAPAAASSGLPRGVDPLPPPDAPEPTSPTPPSASATTKPATTTPANAPTVTAPAAVPATAPTVPAAPVPAVRIPINYTSVEGVLLRYESGDQHWYVHPRRSEVHAEEIFASPEPFEGQFDFDRGAFKVTLLSDSAMDILPGTEASRLGIGVRRGRVVLQAGAKGEVERLDFRLRVGEHEWNLHFSGPEAVCGVEVLLRDPPGFEKVWEHHGQHVALYVGTGSVQVNPQTDDAKNVAAGERHVLTKEPWPSAPGDDLSANWLDPQRRERGEILKRFAAKFEKEFDPTVAADLSIPSLTKDPNPKMAELAARCLSVTEQYSALVQALATSEHEEARAVAAHGLRFWLGQATGRGELLQRELAGHYSGDDIQTVYRLLWGLTPEDAKDKITSLQLIDLLRSTRVEFREMAFQQLVQLTGRKYDYRPTDTPSQRERAVVRWMSHIQREGGSLLKAE